MSEEQVENRTLRGDPDQLARGVKNLPWVLGELGLESLRPLQVQPVYKIMAGVDSIVVMPTGCHERGHPILMHSGEVKPVESVEVGDVLMSADGKSPAPVTELHRGRSEMCRVTPVKGEPFRVNKDHILSVYITPGNKGDRPKYVDISVEDYLKSSNWFKHIAKLYRVPCEFNNPSPDVDAWALGVIIGGAGDKRVPDSIKRGPRSVRLDMIAGLIDTDGHLTGSNYDWISKSEGLADDLVFMCRSVGLSAFKRKCRKGIKSRGFVGTYWRVTISGDCDMVPCRMARKRAPARRQIKSALVTGFSVEPAGEGEYYGFSVDTEDRRYLDGNFVAHHNSGKSIIYTVPALCLDWKALIISPLVALMQDQVQSMWTKYDTVLKAGQLSGQQTEAENELVMRDWAAGELQFLFLAPERLDNPRLREALRQTKPDLLGVDEVHVVSSWSDNFRHHYTKIGDLVEELQPKVVAAFTATAPKEVIQDVRRVLRMPDAWLYKKMPRRTNLHLSSKPFYGYTDLSETVNRIPGSCIVYCATVKEVEQCAANLQALLPMDTITFYHGQLKPSEKAANMRLFMEGRCRVVVCTNAFGMGIDKGDIRGVVHRNFPGTPEAASQEIGRAGRDGLDSWCVMYYDEDTKGTHEYFWENGNPQEDVYRRVYQVLKDEYQSNGRRPIQLTIDRMAARARCSAGHVETVMQQFAGAGVVRRERSSDKTARIKIVQNASDTRFQHYMRTIRGFGTVDAQGFVKVNMQALADQLELTLNTVRNYLNGWHRDGWIDFQKPYNGSVTTITGGLDLVDFPRLAEKRKREREKLDKVLEFVHTPDDQKHDWLDNYFEVDVMA
jgi:RecQ family ATP-dependent DNA helicase